MNTQRIAAAIREIDRLTLALNWLREYGDYMKAEDQHTFKVFISPTNGSACVGAKEPTEQLSAITRLHIKAILKHLIEDAQNTIEIHTAAILEEAQSGSG